MKDRNLLSHIHLDAMMHNLCSCDPAKLRSWLGPLLHRLPTLAAEIPALFVGFTFRRSRIPC